MAVIRSVEERWNYCMNLIDCNGNKINNWCIKGKNDFTAYCVFCNVVFNISYVSKYLFMQHAKSPRHVFADKYRRSSSRTQFENTLENDACLDVKYSSSNEMKPNIVNNESEPLNEYEKMLAEKRAKNQEFLKSLAIEEAKQYGAEIINRLKRKKPKEIQKKPEPIIQRASKRKKEHIDYSQKHLYSEENIRLKCDPTEKSFEKALKFKTEYLNFFEDFNKIIETEDCITQTPFLYDNNILRRLFPQTSSLRISNITAISWFPSTEYLVLAVGDRSGSLSLSTFKESDMRFYTFSIHSEKIIHLQVNPYNPSHLISASIDGKVLCCDIQAQLFSEVLNISERGCTYFDFISPSCYIVSLTDGQLIITDSRKKYEGPTFQPKPRPCHNYHIYTINVHPMKKDYFVTAAKKDKCICVWDIRQLNKPVIRKTEYMTDVVSAAFSPVSGNFLLSKSPGRICIFDSTSITDRSMNLHSTFQYTEQKQQHYIRPVWLPNSDDTFVYNLRNSSTLHVFDKDLNKYPIVSRNDPKCKKLYTFHPFQSALACVTTTDKISVYA